MTVPIATSPGRAGFGPELSLSYDSGAGNGPFGFGWNLALSSITRKTDKGLPQYLDAEESDVFILSGAEDLVPVLNDDGSRWSVMRGLDDLDYRVHRYRPRIEGLFARIERWTRSDGDMHWRSVSRHNILTIYGKDQNARIVDPTDPTHIFSWLICETRDDKGNAVLYQYKPEDGAGVDLSQAHERNRGDRDEPRRTTNRYLKRIRYGNRETLLDGEGQRPPFLNETQIQDAGWMFDVVFDYGEHDGDAPNPDDAGQWAFRDDPFSSYRAGFEVRTTRLCQRVLMFHHFPDEEGVGNDCLVRSTHVSYSHEQDPTSARNPVYTFLLAVTQSGYQRDNGGYLQRSLPPLEFEYTQPIAQDAVEEVDAESLENLPIGLDGTVYQWTDLHGEGIPGILTEQAGAWFYKRNLSPINMKQENGVTHAEAEFAPVEVVAVKPNLALSGGAQFMDLAGDGQPDLVVLDGPMPGFYEHDGAEGWQPFRPFTARLNRDTRDPNLKFVDLDGDGHPDVLISEDNAFVWHPSLTEEGFGPAYRVAQALDEERGPRLVFADGTQSIYLSDMSGDGLTDLVRIRNGEVCYWPNLGYGRFGAKITMDHAPHFDHPDQFDQKRIRPADIDGTGTTDIIYIHRDGVRLYFNQSGNSWSEPQTLRVFPRVDDLVSIVPTALLGNGTACLVWSSPLPGDAGRPMRYVNLMGRQKPHLLVKTANNLGAETHVHYGPSTKFYLQDKRDGKPWITRLPFPVHVVERVETFDHISRNRFVTRYAYHHGYFDGEEREFRGFGMVEQFDTEEFGALSISHDFASGDNIDAASHVPPVLTKTWYHTGAFLDRQHISRQLEAEYYREPDLSDDEFPAQLLPDTTLPPDLSPDEVQEACRALKGSILRQEVYALDETGKELHPYSVSERDYTLKRLQPRAGNRHAVFFAHPRETIDYHYERNPADPRISHSCVLATDEFGNVLQSVAIGYGRRQVDETLSLEDQNRQRQILMTCTENDFTNAVEEDDAYRTPSPAEVRTYELTGLELAGDQTRLAFTQLQEAVESATKISYHATPDPGTREKRLLEQARTLYRPDDLGDAQNDPLALLPLGMLEPLTLPGETYTLAFTPEHLDLVFGDRVNETMLSDDGHYVHFDGDDNWWIPSGRVFMSPNEEDGAAQELAFAQQHFLMPLRFRDPFGQTATVEYDDYDLLPLETRDPLGNRVTAGERPDDGSVIPRIDYRVLQPELMTDPNGNRSAVAFDILGLVAGAAVAGKPGENAGEPLADFQADFEPDLSQSEIDAFFADPRGPVALSLLSNATARIIYDETRFLRLEQPPFAATIARETHVSDLNAGEETAIQVSLAYSDGFGREIQKKIQAEPGPIEEGGEIVSPRWTTSGWTIFNNKGDPVKQYEPFFSADHAFEFGVTVGVSPTLFYDPVERVVATLHPNHTWEKVVFDPWRQTSYDVNDTVLLNPADDPDVGDFFRRLPDADYLPTWHALRTDPAHASAAIERWPDAQRRGDEAGAAAKASAHADTPAVVHFDSLGRPFLSIADNGPDGQYQTRTEQDIEGNPLRIIDDRGNVVMAYQVEVSGNPPVPGYDVAGRHLYENSMDAGERRVLADIGGKPIRSWDGQGHVLRSRYDELQRQTHLFVQREDGPEFLAEMTVYGEGHPHAESLNLRGQVYQLYDGAGVATNHRFDFKGNLLESSRQLAREYRTTVDWSVLANLAEIGEIKAAAAPLLENRIFTTETEYDALSRPVAITTPDNSVTLPLYNEANLLEQMAVRLRDADQATLFVADIDYNAKGQRERIEYGNGAITDYSYDSETFRLMRLRTTRRQAFPPAERLLQDLLYTYDPIGNINSIRDHAQQTVLFGNVQVEPHNDYTYDALYRLIQAEGREHAAQNNVQRDATEFEPIIGIPFPNSPEALQRYMEEYAYDEVGNILSMRHFGGAVERWTRRYRYAEDSNRLLATSLPGDGANQFSALYTYDAHGNMTTMPHLPLMQWNFKDQLQATSRQVVNGGTPETTYYVYDAAGERVRKVTERFQPDPNQEPPRRDERIYIGSFEVYREYSGDGTTVTLERETLHVMDDQQRIAQIDSRTQGSDDAPDQSRRFQLSNHLGSAMLEIDEQANVISYEEYHPYGTSAYRAGRTAAEVSLKRYRYTGEERDEETGLYYHGARYYACWLGRWTAVDPARFVDGTNIYALVKGNPIKLLDPDGRASKDPHIESGIAETEGYDPETREIKREVRVKAEDPFERQERILGLRPGSQREGHEFNRRELQRAHDEAVAERKERVRELIETQEKEETSAAARRIAGPGPALEIVSGIVLGATALALLLPVAAASAEYLLITSPSAFITAKEVAFELAQGEGGGLPATGSRRVAKEVLEEGGKKATEIGQEAAKVAGKRIEDFLYEAKRRVEAAKQGFRFSNEIVAMALTTKVRSALEKLSGTSGISRGELSKRFHRIKSHGATPEPTDTNYIDDVTGDVFDGTMAYIGNVFNDF
ncbi:MAG: toxin [Deltaproteobacteria bacterium]|nr:toxin [Deltaproteobacteria bacterium]